jgi:hypothetical protein
MSYKFLRYDAGNIRTIAASNSHTNSSIYKGTGKSYFQQYKIVSQNKLIGAAPRRQQTDVKYLGIVIGFIR